MDDPAALRLGLSGGFHHVHHDEGIDFGPG
jgi:hypothetical protein